MCHITGQKFHVVSSTHSCGVRHTGTGGFLLRTKFQSTHSLRSATPPAFSKIILSPVSIHALLAECDQLTPFATHSLISFNPRTPCGVLPPDAVALSGAAMFQSTHSLRSATHNKFVPLSGLRVFNPRTPCGVRLTTSLITLLRSATVAGKTARHVCHVSIHALLAECDKICLLSSGSHDGFNPRTPYGCDVHQPEETKHP